MTEAKRGEIWHVRFPFMGSVGYEVKKARPAAIMTIEGVGEFPLQIVVPILGWKAKYSANPWMVYISPTQSNGLSKDSAADAFQVRSISVDRLIKKIGVLSGHQIEDIAAAIALCVGYEPE